MQRRSHIFKTMLLAGNKVSMVRVQRKWAGRIMRSCSCCCRGACSSWSCMLFPYILCIKGCSFSRLEMLMIRDSFRLKYLFLSNLAEYLLDMVFKITDLRYNCRIHVARSAFKVIDLLIHFFKAFSVISGVFC